MTNCVRDIISKTAVTNEKGERLFLIQRYDESAESPRTFSEHFSKFYTWLARTESPDRAPHLYDMCAEMHTTWNDDPVDLFKQMNKKDMVALTVYKYEHGGVQLKATNGENPFSCAFDSCFAGFIFAKYEDIRKAYDCKRISHKVRKQVEGMLKAEVDEYSEYINGDVYYWTLEDEDGNEIDSVGNIYGEYYVPYDYLGVTPIDNINETD